MSTGISSVEGLWAAAQELPKAGNGRKTPLWRVLTGIEVGKEDALSPGERAAGLRKLIATATRVIRREFREHKKGARENQCGSPHSAFASLTSALSPAGGERDLAGASLRVGSESFGGSAGVVGVAGATPMAELATTLGGDGLSAESDGVQHGAANGRCSVAPVTGVCESGSRTGFADGVNKEAAPFFGADRNVCTTAPAAADAPMEEEVGFLVSPCWDPVARVCHFLGIGQRMLSNLSKEICGYSAIQLADRVRVEDYKQRVQREVEAFVRSKEFNFPYEERTDNAGYMQELLYREWREHKKEQVTETTSGRAILLGFGYAARLRAACWFVYGTSPEGLELAALKEVATYFAARHALERRVFAMNDRRPNSDRKHYALRPYKDLWAKLRRERPEWLMAMKAEYGLEERFEKDVDDLGEGA